VVGLVSRHAIHQSIDDQVIGDQYTFPGLIGMNFFAPQGWAIEIIVKKWVCDSDMPGALVADDMGR
jgi:hypothetical protein